MSRAALVALSLGAGLIAVTAYGCSKSAGKQEKTDELGGGGKINVPGSRGGGTEGMTTGAPGGAKGGGNDARDARNRLTAEEGQIAIEAPTDAKAGTVATVKIHVTPGSAYKVNTEFPTKLTLDTPEGMTLEKAVLTAGGAEKAKLDAETFDESKLTFHVKLTPGKSGSYTVNGTFKFAVCDKAGSTCLAKKEAIAIQVAAN